MRKQFLMVLILIIGINSITVFGSGGKEFINDNLQDSQRLYSNNSLETSREIKKIKNIMDRSLSKINYFINSDSGDEHLTISNLKGINSEIEIIKVGEKEFNYYIGDPNGTTYNKRDEKEAIIRDKLYYHPDKDSDGNILMYIWEGNKNLSEMKDIDYSTVASFIYATPISWTNDYYTISDYSELLLKIPTIRNSKYLKFRYKFETFFITMFLVVFICLMMTL